MTTIEFNTHVAHLRPLLMKVGKEFFHNEEEAQDVAQEALMRLWICRDSLPVGESLSALAVRIAKNVCISLWRKQKLRAGLPLEVAPQVTSGDRADSLLEEKENKRLLQAAIESLTPSERRLFLLKQEPEIDVGQMAILMGMTSRSVSAKLSAARRKLLEYITKHNR
ncbi:MAG: sigma-70 family RNA polymerase sigma factor [Bacteroidaceae bacterium]|nr:sigma-70 family RNA polymerase sigma factor [Bacteroidaceae bacterium]MBQ6049833.1 sigma-70 family RNA polymerase sigma factor [Bacteroidaceae bacterium]MBR3547917.1 sigma-70 family RNA polymerase sigma factor [Bacteroidaceae bacterium]